MGSEMCIRDRKKVEELTMKKTFFEKLSAMLTGYYKSFSMDF